MFSLAPSGERGNIIATQFLNYEFRITHYELSRQTPIYHSERSEESPYIINFF